MAGGGFVVNGPATDYGGRVTASVIITCMMAASGGLIFGYDIGISGGWLFLFDQYFFFAFSSILVFVIAYILSIVQNT